ncbi:hypothetical protein [Spirosoma sp. KNUC1025]|uniref:hypothetical protein n=1 Tax=Spirosoma sp. KNUC1025 TaxID=2894082 RepID=UPI003864957E|nr:hypothetical protein LN737_15345 [Spirosoma sp. KNUC1025]
MLFLSLATTAGWAQQDNNNNYLDSLKTEVFIPSFGHTPASVGNLPYRSAVPAGRNRLWRN